MLVLLVYFSICHHGTGIYLTHHIFGVVYLVLQLPSFILFYCHEKKVVTVYRGKCNKEYNCLSHNVVTCVVDHEVSIAYCWSSSDNEVHIRPDPDNFNRDNGIEIPDV